MSVPVGTLFVVATPIGNLEDLSRRAARVLGEVDVVAAEDTRVTRKLLAHLGVHPAMVSLHAHSRPHELAAIVDRLAGGASVALLTDAGAPGVSDPGQALVEAAAERAIPIVPLPGPSAVTTALMVSGLGGQGHRFVGFLPRTAGRRRRTLEALRDDPAMLVLFEAPGRLADLLATARDALGPTRRAVVCRELTKLHEQIARGTLGDLVDRDIPARGEVTVVIEGALEATALPGETPLEERVAALLEEGHTVRDAADRLAAERRIARREAYQLALAVQARRQR